MIHQKLFRYTLIEKWKRELAENKNFSLYLNKKERTDFEKDDILENRKIIISRPITLVLPESEKENHDFENAKRIYEAYKNLDSTQASDTRIWTYLAHVNFWDYMKKRSPVEKQSKKKIGKYVLDHWFINGLNSKTLLRHNISKLWWGAYLTYDGHRKDPYELTKELFSMLDYTRTLLPSVQGRNNIFVKALLEYVVENKNLFSKAKESKIRYLMKKLNYWGGYAILPSLTKDEIKKILSTYKDSLKEIRGRIKRKK